MAEETPHEKLIRTINAINDPEVIERLSKLLEQQQDPAQKLEEVSAEVQILKAEKDKFFSIISFWLGSPLKSLDMLAKMLVSDVEKLPPVMVKEMADHLYKQVQKVKQNMGNLITWSDLAVENYSFSTSEVSLHQSAESALKLHQEHASKKEIDLINEVPDNLAAMANSDFLEIALSNFISNAVKFTTKEGKVTISAQPEGDFVVIKITDTGIGMGNAKMKNIFQTERKSTQKGTAQEEGFGLGMIVAKALLQLHQAEIELQSERGKGTVVSFKLSKP